MTAQHGGSPPVAAHAGLKPSVAHCRSGLAQLQMRPSAAVMSKCVSGRLCNKLLWLESDAGDSMQRARMALCPTAAAAIWWGRARQLKLRMPGQIGDLMLQTASVPRVARYSITLK